MCPSPKSPAPQAVTPAPAPAPAAEPFDPEAERRAIRRADLEAKRNSRDKLRIDRGSVSADSGGAGISIA